MTLDKQDNFIQHVMVNCDAAMAATAQSMTQIGTSKDIFTLDSPWLDLSGVFP
jgi:hypothetical protein